MKKTRLKARGTSDVSVLKEKIQKLVREIVIKRDGGCVLRSIRHCGGEIGQSVLQADHLVTRANSATFADTRLIVCLCKSCHGGWKQWNKEEYDHLMRSVISKERVELWDKCKQDRFNSNRTTAYDWKMEIVALEQELLTYN